MYWPSNLDDALITEILSYDGLLLSTSVASYILDKGDIIVAENRQDLVHVISRQDLAESTGYRRVGYEILAAQGATAPYVDLNHDILFGIETADIFLEIQQAMRNNLASLMPRLEGSQVAQGVDDEIKSELKISTLAKFLEKDISEFEL